MTKIIILVSFMVMISFSLTQVYAQNDTVTYVTIIDKIDDLLHITIPIALMGVSFTGAAFLLSMLQNADVNEKKIRIRLAKRNLIRSFIIFLICVIMIFLFDFIEIINEGFYIQIIILDVIIAYSFFVIGLVYLVKAAREIYRNI